MVLDMLDRFRGCLLGGAVGDALGMPTEGYTAEEIQTRFGLVQEMMPASEGNFHFGLQAGQFTDDTEETLLLAESMIEASGFSADRFADKLVAWGTAWTLDERLNRGVGFTTRSSVENMIAGRSWRESGIDVPTCGSAMRAAPVGLLYHCDLDLVSRYADLQSLPTHSGPAARAGAVAVATGVALCLKGFSKEAVLRMAVQKARQLDAKFADRLLLAGSLQGREAAAALAAIGTSPLVSETVPAAFYCFLKFEPEEALINAASSGGDTDSIASIAGSLFGAAYGARWIPERWLAPLEQKDRIEQAAVGLADLSAALCP
jgi:ADP-ribosylglycohydrolase